ncbi:NADP-dependent 3-hydroxy acid dehydrogenase YdfG [Paenarthrobacter nitroguajacolicus]|uniref:oxidoreductase n=1 Tax=Paenarthrobacter nitroguajacolicus TaxID=211146 RepID=UPI002863D36F|nr:oxidoreductase [Paenarthrobacter nitroguajacolicus]MDR6987024.1 NADP-dependent 3-hydroxy acid dehydrogenase YdfG [Paenarthrobacter nitroguajacolicus]
MASRIALVTGASTGIGFEAAIALRAAGLTVYAGARRVEKMEPLKRLGITVMALDVTSEESMASAVALVEAAHGRVDVLVNNAGYGSYGSLEEVPLDEGRRQFEVNVMGLARMMQLVIPGMRTAHSGKIINITSIGGKIHEPLGAWYHGTKFAVEGMSDSLRLELQPHGIDVVVIEPSGTNTEWGTIAGEGLLAASGDGPYQQQAHIVAAALASTSGEGHVLSTPARVVARAIVRAATAKRPRTRYPVGRGAWSVLAMRRILPDRAFDAVFWNFYRRLAG